MQVQIHDSYIAHGYISGQAVNSALYWASRVARNLEGRHSYAIMHKKLLAIIWDHFRTLDFDNHAITTRGPNELSRWTEKYLPRLSPRQMIDGRQFAEAVEALRAAGLQQTVRA